jgi:hypothetical protein
MSICIKRLSPLGFTFLNPAAFSPGHRYGKRDFGKALMARGRSICDQASLDSDLNGCVCANDICKIYGIEQLDLDGEQLGHLGIRTRGCKAG